MKFLKSQHKILILYIIIYYISKIVLYIYIYILLKKYWSPSSYAHAWSILSYITFKPDKSSRI